MSLLLQFSLPIFLSPYKNSTLSDRGHTHPPALYRTTRLNPSLPLQKSSIFLISSKFRSNLCSSFSSTAMAGFMVRFGVAVLLISLVLMVCNPVDAYRKPPFNGSIFGKRAGTIYIPPNKTRLPLSFIYTFGRYCNLF